MLNALKLRRVGPAKELEMELKPRMNFLTGDNGLGKSFLLDVAWWALTHSWARTQIKPHAPPSQPKITFELSGPIFKPQLPPGDGYGDGYGTGDGNGYGGGSGSGAGRGDGSGYGGGSGSGAGQGDGSGYGYPYDSRTFTGSFSRRDERWTLNSVPNVIPGLVLYAQVDGGFSVWDPSRDAQTGAFTVGTSAVGHSSVRGQPAYLFKPSDVWDGLRDNGRSLCEGLIRDWASWQREKGEAFRQLSAVLKRLSPSSSEPLEPGQLKRISITEALDHPTLRMPYGQDVALVHASAGMRRVVALAYLLVWTWREHVLACELQGAQPSNEVIFLVDEVEAHLHPQWQRRIVPALLDVMDALTGTHDVSIQLIAATHSPLVLASTETRFEPDKDAIWELDLVDGEVKLSEYAWRRRGDANAWLTSSVFDLGEARSIEAEDAIRQALELTLQETPDSNEVKNVDALLRAALSDVDRFWIRWRAFAIPFLEQP